MKEEGNVQKKKEQKGVLTVEAAIVLPLFIMVMFFVLSMMKLFYFHLVMQQALQNVGRTFSEYGYVLDEVVGLEKLNLTAEAQEQEDGLEEKIAALKEAVQMLRNSMEGEGGFLDKVEGMAEAGRNLGGKINDLAGWVKEFWGKQIEEKKRIILNYFFVSALNEGGGALVEWMVGDYLKEMQAQNGTISNIRYFLAVDAHDAGGGEVTGTKDIILVADYDYALNFFFFDKIRIRQSIRIHPWVGGETEGVEWGK